MTPTPRLQAHLPLLKQVSRLPEARKKVFLESADGRLIKSICECCVNILNGCIPLSDRQHERLKFNKEHLRRLVHRATPIKEKRKLLQKGGFMSAILTAAIPLIGGLIANAVNRRR